MSSFKNTVLPQPLSPITANVCPRGIVRVTVVPLLPLLALRLIADEWAPPFFALSYIAGAANPKMVCPEESTTEKPLPAGFSFRPGLICSS